MHDPHRLEGRRLFLRGMALGAAALATEGLFTARGLFAEELTRTPRQTEGPYYPDHLPLDTDNDLLIINDGITPAVGTVTHLTGRVIDSTGKPIRGALIEIWQADTNGVYLHTACPKGSARDGHFQGFGRYLTGSTGEYYFRTIKPVAYGSRTPHIHFAVKMKGMEKWTTQCYVKGEPRNETDMVFREIRDTKQRAAVTVDFAPLPDSRIGELAARFDIVLGLTPEDRPRELRV